MGFEPEQPQSQTESINEFAEQMKTMLEEAKAALAKLKDDMTQYYNQKRVWTSEYNPGDQVYLNACNNIQTTRPSKKLSHRHLGPFTIERKVVNNTYCLYLPQSMKQFHPVFNVVKLTMAPPDPIIGWHLPPHPPPLPEIVDGKEEWVVEEILDSKMMNQKLQYLIKWKDIGTDHNTWEPWDNMHAPELKHIQVVEFDLIKFRPVPYDHHVETSLFWRGGMLGDPQHRTFLLSPLLCPRLSTSCLTIITPSLYRPHPSTISLLSTHCHFIVVSLFPLSYHCSYFPFFVFTYILSHTAYSIILLFYGSTFIC